MAQHGLHWGLELRLEALANRIAALRDKMANAEGAEKIEEMGEVQELEARHRALTERLQALDREGPGFRQNAKAELEKIADDLSGTVEDFITWVDSSFQGRRPQLP